MKARWDMKCECCGAPISVGDRFATYASRPWITAHLAAYKRQRREHQGLVASNQPHGR